MPDAPPHKAGQGMGTPNPSPSTAPTLIYEDVAAILGDLYLSSQLRIRSMQSQTAPLFQSFQQQLEGLRTENQELKKYIEILVQERDELKGVKQ